jgi:uncharacterized protein YjdB
MGKTSTIYMRLLSIILIAGGFTFSALAQPHITSVSSLSAVPGATITITGTGFNTTATNNIVFFGNVQATASGVDLAGTQLSVVVPGGAQYAHVSVLDVVSTLMGESGDLFLPSFDSTCYIQGTSTFKPRLDIAISSPYNASSFPRHATIGDVDGDGKPDLLACTYNGNGSFSVVNIYLNNSSVTGVLSFNSTPYQCATSPGGVNIKLADLDRDGKLDIVVACGGSGRISCLRNTSTGTGMSGLSFATKADLNPGVGPQEVAIADYNGDGRPDIAVACSDTFTVHQVKVFTNNITAPVAGAFPVGFFGGTGLGIFDSFQVNSDRHLTPASIAFADFNNDGKQDVVVSNTLDNSVAVLINSTLTSGGNVSFNTYQRVGTATFPTEVQVADINNDANPEIIVGIYGGSVAEGGFQVVPNNGGIFGTPVTILSGVRGYGISAGDFDGDGRTDVVVTSDASPSIKVHRNIHVDTDPIGSGTFSASIAYNMSAVNNQGVTVADIDLDRKADIVVANASGNRVSIFENVATPDTSSIVAGDSVCVGAPLTATVALCSGETGYWSTATGKASVPVGASGSSVTVTGISAGVDTLIFKAVYLSDTNYVRKVVYINAAPDTAISGGPSVLCAEVSGSFTTSATGGTWTSSAPSVAVIDATTGVVTALTAGTTVISYTNGSDHCGTASATRSLTVNAKPNPGTIAPSSGGTCIGNSVSLSETVSTGTWVNMNTAIGTITASTSNTASVQGVAVGADTILYTVVDGVTGCRDTAFSYLAFVESGSSPALAITGPTTLCQGDIETLSNGMPGGQWTSLNPAVASIAVGTGVLTIPVTTSTTNDTVTIKYHVDYTCGHADTFVLLTIRPLPNAGTISGVRTIYLGNTITLTTTGAGGTWTSSAPATATVSASGATAGITGLALGNAIISYTASNVCASFTDTHAVAVVPVPLPPTITSVSPVAGIPLVDAVTITGTNFDATASNNIVYFGATKATVTFASTTSLQVLLPLGATYSSISYLNLVSLEACNQHGLFLPTYDNSCFVTGSTTLKAPVEYAVSSVRITSPTTPGPRHAAIGDLDGDGKSDLVVCNYNSDTSSAGLGSLNVFINNGSAGVISYAAPILYDVASGGTNVKLADLDGDGKLDIIVACSGSGRISCLRNTTPVGGPVSFSAKTDLFPLGGVPETAIADFDGDGKLDIAGVVYSTSRVKVFRNLMTSIPTGAFPTTFFTTTFDSFSVGTGAGFASSIYAADFDGDSRIDLVNGNTADGTVSVLRNISSGSGDINFAAHVDFATGPSGSQPTEVQIAEVNGDNLPEVVIGNFDVPGNIGVLENTSTPGVINFNLVNVPAVSNIYAIAPADMDGDGKVDLVVSRYTSDSVTIMRNTFGGGSIDATAFTFASSYNVVSGAQPQGLSVGDLDGDKKADVVLANYVANTISLFRNTATPLINPILAANDSVCVGATLAVHSNHCNGANVYWSMTNSRATIVVGATDTSATVTGVTAGNDTVVLNVVYLGDTSTVTFPIIVNPLADTGTITGPTVVCVNSTITLVDAATGAWSSSNTSVATVDAVTGAVTGVGAGTATISFTAQSTNCGPRSATRTITVNPLADAGDITASAPGTCVGTSITLSASVVGGTWVNTNSAVATISSTTGTVITVGGASVGTDNILYVVTNTCSSDTAMQSVGVVAPAATTSPITGSPTVCQNDSTQLSNAATGGTWTSTNTAIATVDAVTGMVHGVSAGNVTISYTAVYPCANLAAAFAMTVNPQPAVPVVSGASTLCVASTTSLSTTVTGGTWTSSNNSIATVDGSGNVSGVSNGSVNIIYTFTNSCGTTADTQTITVNALPTILASAGSTTLCAGQSTNLTATGGNTYSWIPAASLASTVGSPVTTNTLSATTTFTVTGTDINSCSNTATVTVNVNALPNVTATANPTAICAGNTSTLTGGGASTYTWAPSADISSTNTAVTTFSGTATATYTVTGTDANSCVNTATVTVTVNTVPTVTATADAPTICEGSSTTLTATGGTTYSWSPSTDISASTGASVTFTGTASATYTVTGSNGSCSDTGIVTITVTPAPVIVASAGSVTLCAGQSTTLSASSATATSYSWTPSASLVTTTGSPVTTNTLSATTTFTVTGSDGTCTADATVTVNVNALPNVTATANPTAICVGGTSTLTGSGASSYTWAPSADISSTNTAVTTFSGTTTATYTVTGTDANSCVNTATVTVTVNTVPTVTATADAPTICEGSSTTLTATGGTTYSWSPSTDISASTGASVTFTGTATATYTVTGSNGSCSDTGIVTITVTPAPAILVTVGSTTLCAGQTTTLSASGYPTYSWSPGTDLSASTGSLVTFSGSNTATYTVTGSNAGCSADTVITITVNPLPDAGVISGPSSSICIGSTTTLSSTVAGGTWSMTNLNATISTVGVVTGVAAGTDTAIYSVTNSCGTAYDSFVVTIVPPAFADTIHGADTMCLTGGTITLTNPVAGGTWISTNTTLATIDASGVVTPLAAGVDTILYVYTNICGSDTAEHQLVIIGTPNAGVISGPSFACMGSTITLTNTVTGGVWSTNNPAIATIDTNGVLTPVDAGFVVVHYTFTNFCGTADTTDTVHVNPLPVAGFISNPVAALCVGQSVTLTDTTSGGVWSTSAPAILTVTSAGVVTGLTSGTGVISYTVTNICGAASVMDTITVNPLPTLTSALGGVICSGTAFTYNPTSASAGATYSWTRATVPLINEAGTSGTGGVSEILTSTSPDTVYATYVYTVSALGCDNSQSVVVTVKPTPILSTDTSITVCSNAPVLYIASSTTENTIFTWIRPAVAGISPTTNNGSYIINETLTSSNTTITQVNYNFTLTAAGCVSTQTVHASVEPAPPTPPHISTTTAPFICLGAMYQNFGTSTVPPTGINYTWSSANAEVWATGSTEQYCLVNFNQNPGLAWVYVSSSYAGFSCTSRDSFAVVVTGAVSDNPEVWYFGSDFTCTPSDEDSYQWGYDDALTLDSTLLAGETNQNYYNPSPDWANKFYWVITSRHGCYQKTYYKVPAAIKNVTAGGVRDMNLYPNPSNGAFTVDVASDFTEQGVLTVTNLVGEKIMEVPCSTNRKVEMHLDQPAGMYFVTVQTAHGKISGKITIVGN